MHFGLTDEQTMIIETTRAFVEAELYPLEAAVERSGHLPLEIIREVQKKAMAAGLYAANMPEEVGGAGLDTCPGCCTSASLAVRITRCTGPAWRGPRTSCWRAHRTSASGT